MRNELQSAWKYDMWSQKRYLRDEMQGGGGGGEKGGRGAERGTLGKQATFCVSESLSIINWLETAPPPTPPPPHTPVP